MKSFHEILHSTAEALPALTLAAPLMSVNVKSIIHFISRTHQGKSRGNVGRCCLGMLETNYDPWFKTIESNRWIEQSLAGVVADFS